MAGELHQPFTRRVPTPDILLRANGWPRVLEEADGT
jgi:hypothetical protein